jgi:hypothetical protein
MYWLLIFGVILVSLFTAGHFRTLVAIVLVALYHVVAIIGLAMGVLLSLLSYPGWGDKAGEAIGPALAWYESWHPQTFFDLFSILGHVWLTGWRSYFALLVHAPTPTLWGATLFACIPAYFGTLAAIRFLRYRSLVERAEAEASAA